MTRNADSAPLVRYGIALKDGDEFVRGDVVRIVTRSGSEAEARAVLAESIWESSPVTADDFDLIPEGQDPMVRPTVSIVTARENDAGLWDWLEARGARGVDA